MSNKLYEFFSLILFIFVIILATLTFNCTFNYNLNDINLNYVYKLCFNFKNIFVNRSQINNVNNDIKYIKINDKYITNSIYIYSLNDGYIYSIDDDGFVIKQNDGFFVNFVGKFDLNFYIKDYIEKDVILGMYYDQFLLYFIKDNKQYDYEEYIKITI